MIPTGRDSRALLGLQRVTTFAIRGFAIVAPFSISFIQAVQILANLSWLGSTVLTRGSRSLRPPLLRPMLLFIAAAILSSLNGVDPANSLFALKSVWIPVVFFLACVNTLNSISARNMVRLVILSGSVSAVVGLTETITNGVNYRIDGTFGHYMTFAGVILLIFLLAASRLIFDRETPKLEGVVTVALLFAALLMTQTRSAWLGLIVGSIPILWSWRKRYLLALPVVAVVVVLLSPQPVKDRIFSYIDLTDVTLNERIYAWHGGMNIFREYPLTGVGQENLGQVYANHRHPKDPRLRFTHLHSNFLQTAAELGALGLLAWLAIWIAYFLAVARIYKRLGDNGSDRALVMGSVAGVVAFLVAGIFECNYRDTEVVSMVYFLMALPFCVSSKEA